MNKEMIRARVVRVIDGDTLIVTIRVRERRHNAPELSQPGGAEAKLDLAREYPEGDEVLLEPAHIDTWGRMVANVMRGGREGGDRGG